MPIELTEELEGMKKRLDGLNEYLTKCESKLFVLDELETKSVGQVQERYELARKTQVEIAELIRKYLSQNRPDEENLPEETLKLARKLNQLGEEQLKRVQFALKEMSPTQQSV